MDSSSTPVNDNVMVPHHSTSGVGHEGELLIKKIEAILESGVVETIRRRQMDLREFLCDIESRLNKTIDDFMTSSTTHPSTMIQDTASMVGGKVDDELSRIIPVINGLTEKKLRFTLTTFLDEYRRILQQNREPERTQIVAELDEHFQDGVDLLVNVEEENAEMREGLETVEEIKTSQEILQSEALTAMKQLRSEKQVAELKVINILKDTDKQWTSAILEVQDILYKPNVQKALGSDLHVLKKNMDIVFSRLMTTSKPDKDLPNTGFSSGGSTLSSIHLRQTLKGKKKHHSAAMNIYKLPSPGFHLSPKPAAAIRRVDTSHIRH